MKKLSECNIFYDKWNKVKKDTDSKKHVRSFKERDIFYIHMGENIGFEQNGKGERFIRPAIIYKKFTKEMFLGIPLSSQIKEGSFFYQFNFFKKSKSGEKISQNIAILIQIRLFSAKRLINKIGVIDNNSFDGLKKRLKELVF